MPKQKKSSCSIEISPSTQTLNKNKRNSDPDSGESSLVNRTESTLSAVSSSTCGLHHFSKQPIEQVSQSTQDFSINCLPQTAGVEPSNLSLKKSSRWTKKAQQNQKAAKYNHKRVQSVPTQPQSSSNQYTSSTKPGAKPVKVNEASERKPTSSKLIKDSAYKDNSKSLKKLVKVKVTVCHNTNNEQSARKKKEWEHQDISIKKSKSIPKKAKYPKRSQDILPKAKIKRSAAEWNNDCGQSSNVSRFKKSNEEKTIYKVPVEGKKPLAEPDFNVMINHKDMIEGIEAFKMMEKLYKYWVCFESMMHKMKNAEELSMRGGKKLPEKEPSMARFAESTISTYYTTSQLIPQEREPSSLHAHNSGFISAIAAAPVSARQCPHAAPTNPCSGPHLRKVSVSRPLSSPHCANATFPDAATCPVASVSPCTPVCSTVAPASAPPSQVLTVSPVNTGSATAGLFSAIHSGTPSTPAVVSLTNSRIPEDDKPLTPDDMEDLNDELSDLNTSINTLKHSYGSIIRSLVNMQNRRAKKAIALQLAASPMPVPLPRAVGSRTSPLTIEAILLRNINYEDKYAIDKFLDSSLRDEMFQELFREVNDVNIALQRFRSFFDVEGYFLERNYQESDFRITRREHRIIMKMLKDLSKAVAMVLKTYNTDLLDMFRINSNFN